MTNYFNLGLKIYYYICIINTNYQMSIAEIQLKLKNASAQQLSAILEILNKKPEPKKRKSNALVEYLSIFKSELMHLRRISSNQLL